MKRFNTFAVASMVFALTVMSGGVASAASYQRTDGTIVDPILDLDGNVSSYSGPNFVPEPSSSLLISLGLSALAVRRESR